MAHLHRSGLVISAAILGQLAGCGERDWPRPLLLAIPATAVVDSFGRYEDASDVETLASISGGRLSPSARYLVITDRAPPHLRVLDRATRETWSFGRRGDGPGELRGVSGFAFLSDSLVIVLSFRQRLETYTIRGEWKGGLRLDELGISGMSVVTGCSGRFFVYGVPEDYRHLDTVPWLHEVDLTGAAPPRPALMIPGKAGGSVRFGALYGVDDGVDEIMVWHLQIQSGLEVGYWVPCDETLPRIFDHTGGAESIETALSAGGGQVVSYQLPDTLFAGAAASGAVAVRALTWKEGEQAITSIRTSSESRCGRVDLIGNWMLLDARQDLIVLTRNDPFPAALVLRWDWMDAVVVDAPCSAT